MGRLAMSQLDVIVANSGAQGNSGARNEVHMNDGSGGFTLVVGTSVSQLSSNTKAIAVLDMDNDGDVRRRPRVSKQMRRQQPRLAIACERRADAWAVKIDGGRDVARGEPPVSDALLEKSRW